MAWRVVGWYKALVTCSAVCTTGLSVSILVLPASRLVEIFAWVCSTVSIALAVEAHALEVRSEVGKLTVTLFGASIVSIQLSDIIDVECGLLSTKVTTLWRRIVLPPLAACVEIRRLRASLRRPGPKLARAAAGVNSDNLRGRNLVNVVRKCLQALSRRSPSGGGDEFGE